MLDNSLRRSGRPMDALGFYKEICARGGFVNRESAKKRIKMPDVLKVMRAPGKPPKGGGKGKGDKGKGKKKK